METRANYLLIGTVTIALILAGLGFFLLSLIHISEPTRPY